MQTKPQTVIPALAGAHGVRPVSVRLSVSGVSGVSGVSFRVLPPGENLAYPRYLSASFIWGLKANFKNVCNNTFCLLGGIVAAHGAYGAGI